MNQYSFFLHLPPPPIHTPSAIPIPFYLFIYLFFSPIPALGSQGKKSLYFAKAYSFIFDHDTTLPASSGPIKRWIHLSALPLVSPSPLEPSLLRMGKRNEALVSDTENVSVNKTNFLPSYSFYFLLELENKQNNQLNSLLEKKSWRVKKNEDERIRMQDSNNKQNYQNRCHWEDI